MSKDTKEISKYVCGPCGYTYPDDGNWGEGIEEGTTFEDLPDDWVCPICGVGKDQFSSAEE